MEVFNKEIGGITMTGCFLGESISEPIDMKQSRNILPKRFNGDYRSYKLRSKPVLGIQQAQVWPSKSRKYEPRRPKVKKTGANLTLQARHR